MLHKQVWRSWCGEQELRLLTLVEREQTELTRAGYHVVFFLSPVGTPSTHTTLPNRSSFCRWSLSSSSLEDEDSSSS